MAKKRTEPTLKSWDEVDQAIMQLCVLAEKRQKCEAEMNEHIRLIKLAREPELKDCASEDAAIRAQIEQFAEAHHEEFGPKKSVERLHGVLSFRTTPPAVKPLNRKCTPELLLDGVRRLARATRLMLIRTTEEIAKDVILAAYSDGRLTDDQLGDAGLRISQHLQFDVTLKAETTPEAR